jgi:hypothetical protein
MINQNQHLQEFARCNLLFKHLQKKTRYIFLTFTKQDVMEFCNEMYCKMQVMKILQFFLI